jgi:uncharacterized protein
MRIVIDADACPKAVKNICLELAKKYGLTVTMVIDDAHVLSGDFETIVVGKDKDAVDHKIVEISDINDILITQDYGLASILIDKIFGIINPSGFKYTKWNIDTLMFQRHMSAKERVGGKRTKGSKKREDNQDKIFREILEQIVKQLAVRK